MSVITAKASRKMKKYAVLTREPRCFLGSFDFSWEQRKAKELFVSTADKGYPELPVLSATQDRGMIRRDENSINIFHDKKNEAGYKRVLPGQFVIHLRSFQGGFAHSAIEGITSPAYTVFGFSEPEKHNSEYWKYVFTSKSFIQRLETVTYGIRDGRSISYEEFLTLGFVYPSKAEQTEIARYLDKLSDLITLHQRKCALLFSPFQALISMMFTTSTFSWEQRKLGELVDVCSGRDYKHLSEGTIPVYGTGGYMLSVNDALSYDRDAIGIGRKGTIDRPYILKAPFWTVDTLFYAIPREKVDLNFAFDIFQNIDWKKKDESTGVPSLSKTAINDIDVLAPKHGEQQTIGQFFAAIDHLITLHQRKFEKLTNVKKSMLEKMFPQNGSSYPEIRFKGFTDPWEQRKLGDISEIKTGPFGSTLHADDYVSDGTPIITTEHFKTGALPRSKNGLPQVSDSDYKRLTAYTLDDGDIVFSRVGSVDINALITPFQSNWLFSGRVLRVRPQTDISSKFLHTRLETESIKTDIRTRAVGQTMPSINTEILKITPLVLPSSAAEQEQIGSYFAALDNLITLHQRELEKLQNIKKSMLEKMFV